MRGHYQTESTKGIGIIGEQSGPQTASRANPSHPWSPPNADRLIAVLPFILPQIGPVADYFNLDLTIEMS